MKFVINPKFFPELKNRSGKALEKAGFFIENQLKKAVPKDTRDLEKSIKTDLIKNNIVRVGSLSWSAYVQEYGREPWKMPPLDSLVGWVIRKSGLLWSKTQGYNNLPTTTKSAVFLIARKIRDKWITAKHTFSETREANKDKAKKIYLDAMKR